ncbi:MAG TPA: transglycosylase SLT domain-containing protein [Candidatus Caccomonas pullistercoris]|nr:transglycosylase SLT domain-containing protein [Candidatus Caccomonas pullistercoris]
MKRSRLVICMFVAGVLTAGAQTKITAVDPTNQQEETIDLPEGMTYDADSLLQEWNARKYLVPDTNCENPDVNPVFEKDVYVDRLRRIPAVMELAYNDVVQKFIDQYSGHLRRSVSYMLGACNFYVPIFEEALDMYSLPLELKYLPVIESALDPRAVSHAGAVGLWQFMLDTGKRYGLEVNSLIDERRDPIKSSYAAAHYLSDLYAMFGDWNLVIAAYNCGPNAVNKAIHRAGGSRDYWTIYPYLPRETRGYVPAFIAANYIMNYYCEHNICPMKTKVPVSTDTVMLSRDVHFDQIAAVCGVDPEELRTLNPQYRTGLIPGSIRPMTLCLPHAEITAFIDNEDSVYNYRKDELLARRAEVLVNASVAPEPGEQRRKTTAKKKRTTRRSSRKYVTIRSGQTLSELAKRHGTTVSKLRRLNGIKGSNIRAGKRIRVR